MASREGMAKMYCPSIPLRQGIAGEGVTSPLVFQVRGGAHHLVHICLGNQLASVPIPVAEQEAAETGGIACRGVEAAEGFLVAVFLVQEPVGVAFGLHRFPEFFFGILAQRLAGGGFEREGQELRLPASVGVLHAGFVHDIQACNQFIKVIPVIAVRGDGEERGVGFVPSHASAHGEEVAQGDVGLASLIIYRYIA